MQNVFINWCAAQGITTPLQVRGLSGNDFNRFMACDTNLLSPVTNPVLRVPLDACIIDETPEALAERLAYEKQLGAKSKYAPYIDILPKLDTLGNLPRFWSPSRQDLVTDGGRMMKRIEKEAKAAEGLDPWALACVNSRANFLPDDTFAMTPILDLFNHDPTVNTKASVSADNILSLSLIDQSFEAGQEVFISYGDFNNLDTLCSYGFVTPDDNPFNTESVEVRIIRHPPLTITVTSSDEMPIQEIDMAVMKQFLYDDEDEVLYLLASTLQDEAAEARSGEMRAGKDELVANYLTGRAKTLENALRVIQRQNPNLELL